MATYLITLFKLKEKYLNERKEELLLLLLLHWAITYQEYVKVY